MRKRSTILVVGLVGLVLIVSPACVSKKMFRKSAEDSDTRVGSVENAVEANERRISDLRQETDSKLEAVERDAQRAVEVGNSALSRADQAAKAADEAAKGRLLWTVTLSDDRVRFPFGEAHLPSEASAMLDQLSQKVKSYNKALYLEIEGHTDSTGSPQYNHDLGLKRANAVRGYLNEGGIPLHAMNTISFGEAKPVADNSTPDGRAQNRRVVIKVLE